MNKWFKYSIGYSTSLANFKQDNNVTREKIKLSLSISPIQYFFMGVTLYKTMNNVHNKYYEPDFSYSFGYSDWHQDTWGLIYSNYSDNKFNPDEKHNRFNFQAGSWELSYKTSINDIKLLGSLKYIPLLKQGYFSLTSSTKLSDYLLSFKYRRSLHIVQDQATFSAKGFIYKKFYASGSIYLYSHLDRQTFLEPDYAFSFGWKDTRKGKLSIMYSNYYTPTRFNWREEEGPPFDKGAISISIHF